MPVKSGKTGAGRGSNSRVPDPEATGHHTVINERGSTTFKKNDKNPTGFQETKRVDTQGTGHKNKKGETVETPHVHYPQKKRDVVPAKKGRDY